MVIGQADTVGPRWRWVVFVRSILSTVENPSGALFRALGRELVTRGQEVLFLEERANPAVQALLRTRGAAGMAELVRDWPELVYQTYERRTGADLVEWLGRTLATADVALVELGIDPDLTYWVGELTRPHLRTYALDLFPDTVPVVPEQALARYDVVVCSPRTAARGTGQAARHLVVPSDPPTEPAETAARALATLLLEHVATSPPVQP